MWWNFLTWKLYGVCANWKSVKYKKWIEKTKLSFFSRKNAMFVSKKISPLAMVLKYKKIVREYDTKLQKNGDILCANTQGIYI